MREHPVMRLFGRECLVDLSNSSGHMYGFTSVQCFHCCALHQVTWISSAVYNRCLLLVTLGFIGTGVGGMW